MSDAPLILSSERPLHEGGTRWCYAHPDHDGRMVKILKPGATPENVRREARLWLHRVMPLRFHDVQVRDLKTYRWLDDRWGESVREFIPHVHGFVDTDLGPGLMVDRVRNADGSPGMPSTEYMGGRDEAAVRESVGRLRRFVLAEGIPVCDFDPQNIVIARAGDGTPNAKLVDGYGSVDLVPLWRWSRTFATLRSRRAVGKFDRRTRR